MANLFNNHPVVSHSLCEFSDHAYAFHKNKETDDNFIQFAFTGEYVNDNRQAKQAFVDPIQNFIEPYHSLLISWDYNSLLGIADKLMVNCPISVYVIPHDTFALMTSIHLKHAVPHQGMNSCSPIQLTLLSKYFCYRRWNKSTTTRSPILSLASLASSTSYIYFSLDCGCPNIPRNQNHTIWWSVNEPSSMKMAFTLPSWLYLVKASPQSGQPSIQWSSLEWGR